MLRKKFPVPGAEAEESVSSPKWTEDHSVYTEPNRPRQEELKRENETFVDRRTLWIIVIWAQNKFLVVLVWLHQPVVEV